jgi:hypothetical protein
MTLEEKRKQLLIKYASDIQKDFGDGDGEICREFRDLCVYSEPKLAIKVIKSLYEKQTRK